MTVRTITCHDVYNTGASLQAYALAAYIRKAGHEVKILDYKPPYLSGHYRLWGGVSPRYDRPVVRTAYCMAKLPYRIKGRFGKRKREFDHFKRDYLPVTEKRYDFYQALVDDHDYADLYIAGSDQIWNTLFPNGKDPAFYLQFVPEGIKKASYAASFAGSKIEDGWEGQLAEWIGSLDHVSVREQSGLEILAGLGISDACQVLDPVFLLDSRSWVSLSEHWSNPEDKPYVLVYDFDGSSRIAEFAKELARKNDWNVISVLNHPFIQKNYAKEGPIAFLSLIKNAAAVVSNSFHATAFSLIFEKEFFVFDRNEGINARMRDLVALTETEDRLVTEKGVANDAPIRYDSVQLRLAAAVERSKAYLQVVLGDCND